MKILFPLMLMISGVAVAQGAGVASLSWTATTTNVDGSAVSGTITYNIYEGIQGSGLTKVQSGISGTTASVTGLAGGTTQCFAVTSVEGGVESAQSTSACKVIPLPTPSAPAGLTVK